MNKYIAALLITVAATISGCAQSPDNFDYSYNKVTPLGIKVRVDDDAVPISLDAIDEYYRSTSQCVLGYVPDPFFLIVITSNDVIDKNGKIVSGIIRFSYRMPIIMLKNEPYWWGYQYSLAVISHELVHALLWYQGKSVTHSMPEFNKCSIL